MAARKPRSSRGERWVPATVAKAAKAAAPAEPRASKADDQDTDEWLVPSTTEIPRSRRPARPRKAKAPARRRPSQKPKAAPPRGEEGERTAELEALQQRLADAEQRAERAEKSEVELRAAHSKELTQLGAAHRREVSELSKRADRAERRAGDAIKRRIVKEARSSKSTVKQAASNGRHLDANEVDFEDLRALGLTVAQSARVIATRDVRNGFDSLKELDDLPDLSSDVVSTLKKHLQIRSP